MGALLQAARGALFVWNPIFREPTHKPPHPLAIPRASAAFDLASACSWLDASNTVASSPATDAEICRFHDPDYLACLRRAERDGVVTSAEAERHRLGVDGNGIYSDVHRRPATAVGGTLLACRLALRPGTTVVHHVGGGTHHALPDRASGFCYLNDAVLGLMAWLDAGLTRVAYVDIDAHHGDGVEFAFAGDRRVRTISVHEAGRWPRTGGVHERAGGIALNLPAPPGLNDTEMRLLATEAILPTLERFRPEAILLQCGADALADDPQSRLALSNNAHLEMCARLRAFGCPFVVLGGGGYNPFTVARCWAAVWGLLAGRDLDAPLPEAARAVLGAIAWPGARRRPLTPAHLARLRDAPLEGPVRRDTRRLVAAAMEGR